MQYLLAGAGAAGSVRERLDALPPPAAGEEGAAGEREAARALLKPIADACGDDAGRFLAEVALGTEVDVWDPRADRISLLTLHAAKGLEFETVFIAGCEDGLLPLEWSRRDPASLEEERRLFYVGVTRAKSSLVLTRAKRRLVRGKVRDRSPSPYLADVEERLLDRRRVRLPAGRKAPDPQIDLFA